MFFNYNKYLKADINALSGEARENLLAKMRRKVDFYDRILVYILNRRTKAAIVIGKVKISLQQPIYSPQRERDVMAKIYSHNKGPLTNESLERIYERVLDESRSTQKSESSK